MGCKWQARIASISMVTDFDCWHPDHDNDSNYMCSNAKSEILNFEKFIDMFRFCDNYSS